MTHQAVDDIGELLGQLFNDIETTASIPVRDGLKASRSFLIGTFAQCHHGLSTKLLR
jgi:Asp/Glu/hydantoin racemase